MFVKYLTSVLLALYVRQSLATVYFHQFRDRLERDQAIPTQHQNHWALLVAGSNTWDNYRHQADVCHAYQILKKHGFPEERIVVMMYDDIAHNTANPTPGVIINRPNGPNVWPGVKIDYRREDVTPKNFLNILSGNKEKMKGVGTGRVIESGPDDHVFVNFVDHGAPGILAFPDQMLSQEDLISTLKEMHAAKKYKQMVVYVEACESGSMFDKVLPNDINIFVTTAASPSESSYACYFSNKYQTFLGDVYSVKWMEDSDKENLNTETLYKQFSIVRKETNTSHVQEYGQKSISREDVAQFQGKKVSNSGGEKLPEITDAVRSEDVAISILTKKLTNEKTFEGRQRLAEELSLELQTRMKIQNAFEKIARIATKGGNTDLSGQVLNERLALNNRACYRSSYQLFDRECMKIVSHDFVLRHLYILVNLCELGYSADQISAAITTVCN